MFTEDTRRAHPVLLAKNKTSSFDLLTVLFCAAL
jgi:hypothetical protein